MKRHRPQLADYTVGWICALPIELAAAQEMLDDQHPELPHDYREDTNVYTLGRIGDHNVVIVCLPSGQIGNNVAAVVATEMKARFTSIRFGLMVGIGGGVPSSTADIRLGDVVVSQPDKQHGGVVQYDSGKSTPSGFERTGALNAPPRVLLNVVSKFRANEFCKRNGIGKHLGILTQRSMFNCANVEPDILFEPSYQHVSGGNCDMCKLQWQINREQRVSDQPIVHFGTIASGNRVMRDGIMRDSVSNELGGVLCFEMEGAGLMNNFPCLVVRGICDYSDSHKNKAWQPYAAATAAACAKEILLLTPTLDKGILMDAKSVKERQKLFINSMDDKSASRFVSMLSPVNQSRQSLAIQPVDPDDGMYHWVFKNIDFRYWEKGTSTKALWVSGSAGLNFKGISRQIAEMQLPKTSKNDKYGLHFCCSEKTDFEFLAHTFMHRIFQKSPASTIILAKLVFTSLMDSYWQDRAIEPLDVSNKREILQSDSLDAVLTEMLGLREDYMAKAWEPSLVMNGITFNL